ncbi:MAG TPA: N-6 DNA methylase [Chloroflexota bacterium]|nr:N-6 DNA methylase [Chloroflexota bacterium]
MGIITSEQTGKVEPRNSETATQLRLPAHDSGVQAVIEAGPRAEAGPVLGRPEPKARVTSSRKALGAYYTDERIASFLLRWAVTTGRETVLDPSFGGGIFLKAAAERIGVLGGDSSQQIFGVEIDDAACHAFVNQSAAGVRTVRLLRASFFDIASDDLPPVDSIVGNPPFIRYQRFTGEARRGALRAARDAGVAISELTSSWAPFLVHAVRFIKRGGRLAMVVPAELLHATYARPVLVHLEKSFRVIRILTFGRKLFPELSEDTVLLLAAGRGEPFDRFSMIQLSDVSALATYENVEASLPSGTAVDKFVPGPTQERLAQYLLPESLRDLYRELRASPQVAALADLADVGIGYVTGDNDYFHVGKKIVSAYGLPSAYLRPAVRRGSDLSGLRFTLEDWRGLHEAGRANLLLHLPNTEDLPDSVRVYLDEGVRVGVPNRYKCTVRNPWYRVPHVYDGDAFVTYMSGSTPKFVANEAQAVSPNTLLVIRLHPLSPRRDLSTPALAGSWQTSLTALSCELEGHSLGGGMLKLEPSEAERVIIPLPDLPPYAVQDLADELDTMLRRGKAEVARERADALLLRDGLGLSAADVSSLREGWQLLRSRRLSR